MFRFLINAFSLFTLEKPPLPVSHPRALSGIGPTTCSWVWATPTSQRFNPINTSSSPVPPPQWFVQGQTQNSSGTNERGRIPGHAPSFSRVMWYTDVRTGTATATLLPRESLELLSQLQEAQEKANKKAERSRRKSESLETSFGTARSSLTWSQNYWQIWILMNTPNKNS